MVLHSARAITSQLRRSQSKTSEEIASLPLEMLAGYASKDGEGSNHEGSPDTLNRRKTIGFLENKRRDTFNEPD